METRSESAANAFRAGFNCAQSVFASHAADYGRDHDLRETVCVKCVRDAVSIVEQARAEEER